MRYSAYIFISFFSVFVLFLFLNVQVEAVKSSSSSYSLKRSSLGEDDENEREKEEKSSFKKQKIEENDTYEKKIFSEEFLTSAFQGSQEKQHQLYDFLTRPNPSPLKLNDSLLRLLQQHVDKENAFAEWLLGHCWGMGYIMQDGALVEPDYNKTLEFYKKSAEGNNQFAQLDLGDIYDNGYICNGRGIHKVMKINLREAVRLYTLSAKQGNSDAQYYLGSLYEDDCKVYDDESWEGPDYEAAVYWLTLSAKQGHAEAQFCLGMRYERGWDKNDGTRVLPNMEEAVHWYTLSAEQKNPDAQYALGKLYKKGWVKQDGTEVGPDLERALDLFTKSVAQEKLEVHYDLGELHESGWTKQDGTVVPPNYRKAFNNYYLNLSTRVNYQKTIDVLAKYFPSIPEGPVRRIPTYKEWGQKIEDIENFIIAQPRWSVNLQGMKPEMQKVFTNSVICRKENQEKEISEERENSIEFSRYEQVSPPKTEEENQKPSAKETILGYFTRKEGALARGTTMSTQRNGIKKELSEEEQEKERKKLKKKQHFYKEISQCLSTLGAEAYSFNSKAPEGSNDVSFLREIILGANIGVSVTQPQIISYLKGQKKLPIFKEIGDLDVEPSKDEIRLYKHNQNTFLTLGNREVRAFDRFIKAMVTLENTVHHYKKRAENLARVAKKYDWVTEELKILQNPKYVSALKSDEKIMREKIQKIKLKVNVGAILRQKEKRAFKKYEDLRSILTEITNALDAAQPQKRNKIRGGDHSFLPYLGLEEE